MRFSITVCGLCGLVVAAACSDDGLTVQNQNSSTSSAGSGGIESAATGEDQATATAGGSGGTTSPADTSATETSPPHDTDTGEPPSDTTGPELDTEGSTTGGTDSTDGTDTTTGEPCMPITEDPSAIGQACMIEADCPAEYTCQSFQGIVLQQTCQILCTMDCECPMGLVCVPVMDKAASWMQCQ